MTDNPPFANPYVGPRTFQEDEADRFFGRERESRELLALVVSERLTLFYAQSGAGKSSLINARLVPWLHGEGFAVLPVARVSGVLPADVDPAAVDNIFVYHLLLGLSQKLAEQRGQPAPGSDLGMPDLAHTALARFLSGETGPEPPGTSEPVTAGSSDDLLPHVLIIDQFEELLTTYPSRWPERSGFFEQLSAALARHPNLWVVLTMREDYVPSLEPYTHLVPNRLRARFYMQRMGIDAAREAVERPAANAGRPFAQGVAKLLVDNLCRVRAPGEVEYKTGEYVEPVQLQVVCFQLWEDLRDRAAATIELADLERLAGGSNLAEYVDRALSDFYERAISRVVEAPDMGISELALRSWFSNRLITETGTRSIVFRNETSGETEGLPNRAVDLLAAQFLLRTELRAGGAWVELVHDRFIEPIRNTNQTWLEKNRNPLTLAAQAWREAGRDPLRLYTGSQLTAAMAELKAHPENFGDVEQEFIEASHDMQRRMATRRQRFALAAAAMLVLVLAALTAWALLQSAIARDLAMEAQDARAEAEALALEAQDARDTAIFLAGRERNARREAEANATIAVAAKATAEAASTKAVAEQVAAQAEAVAKATALKDLEVALQINLTSQAKAAQVPSPTATTVSAPTATATQVGVTPSPPGPPATLTPTPTRTPAPPSPTPNRTVIAQQTQLAGVRATQTVLARPTIPPPNGRIVYTSNRGNPGAPVDLGSELWSINLARGDRTQLTTATGAEATYSRARDRIAFTAQVRPGAVDIFEIPPSGGEPRPLDEHSWSDWEPSYAPDGQRVAFTSSRDNQDWEVWTMGVDGSDRRQLTSDDPALNWSPAWSPDGRYIAYFSTRQVAPGRVEVWRMNADGSNKVQLTSGNWVERNPEAIRGLNWELSWSPDGQQIVFPSNRDGNREIYVMDRNGQNQRNLTQSPGSNEFDPAWSLDGNWIAGVRETPNGQRILLKSIDGRQEIDLTSGSSIDRHPVWLP